MKNALNEAIEEVVLYGSDLWPIESLLENCISVIPGERSEASMLMISCKQRNINYFCFKLCLLIDSCENRDTRLLSVITLKDELTGNNHLCLYMLNT